MADLQAPRQRPNLRVVGRDEIAEAIGDDSILDPQSRDVLYRTIRDTARVLQLGWFLRRHTRHVHHVLERLDDRELLALEKKFDRARECLRDDISFEDAGLM